MQARAHMIQQLLCCMTHDQHLQQGSQLHDALKDGAQEGMPQFARVNGKIRYSIVQDPKDGLR